MFFRNPVKSESAERSSSNSVGSAFTPKDEGNRGSWWGSLIKSTVAAVNVASDAYSIVYNSKADSILPSIDKSTFCGMSQELLSDMKQAAEFSAAIYHRNIFDSRGLSLGKDGKFDSMSCYVRDTETLWIVTRGTHTSEDVLHDSTWISRTKRVGDLDLPIGVVEKCESIIPSLYDHLNELHLKKIPVKRICFTGHSLGGAVAIGLYLHWNTHPIFKDKFGYVTKSEVYTLGAPLVLNNPTTGGFERYETTDESTTSSMNTRLADSVHNIVFQLDIVPRLLGKHKLPLYITENTLGNYMHLLMTTGIHRETYRPFGRFYTLREPDGISTLFNTRNMDQQVLSCPLGYVSHPELDLLPLFPPTQADFAFGMLRDHNMDRYLEAINAAVELSKSFRRDQK